jgi:murein L,D-transpeptidase YafK
MVRVATYSICSTSGSAGPKKAEGDGQVPEGFYTLDYYKRKSTYYLAMRVNYPNARDRQLKYTGSAIMIHGKCVSIGCLAMTDDRIQELWVLARSASKYGRVHVHIYPRRDLAKAIASTKDKALQAFWRNLQQGHALFERNRTIPRIGAKNGVYQFR